MNTPPENRPSLLPRFIGRLLLGIGAGTAGGFMVRQMKEPDAGPACWAFIVAGVVCAVVGFVMVRKSR